MDYNRRISLENIVFTFKKKVKYQYFIILMFIMGLMIHLNEDYAYNNYYCDKIIINLIIFPIISIILLLCCGAVAHWIGTYDVINHQFALYINGSLSQEYLISIWMSRCGYLTLITSLVGFLISNLFISILSIFYVIFPIIVPVMTYGIIYLIIISWNWISKRNMNLNIYLYHKLCLNQWLSNNEYL